MNRVTEAEMARAESERVKDLGQIREQTAAVTQELVKAGVTVTLHLSSASSPALPA
jgi:hypothetical protein